MATPALSAKDSWFFLNDVLHRALAVNRQKNYVKALDYEDDRVKMYRWDETIQIKEKAYTVIETGEFINRKPRTVRFYINEGLVVPSGKAARGNRKPKYFFTRKDIMQLRDTVEEYSAQAYGPIPLPSREQLRSMLAVGSILYVKSGDDFVPVWQAKF